MKGVMARVVVYQHHLLLDDLWVSPEARGRGLARRKLRQVCLAADRMGMPIELYAVPQEASVDFDRLCRLYHEAGFEDCMPRLDYDYESNGRVHSAQAMIRLPQRRPEMSRSKNIRPERPTVRVSGRDLPLPPTQWTPKWAPKGVEVSWNPITKSPDIKRTR